MSHIVTVELELKDKQAIINACTRLTNDTQMKNVQLLNNGEVQEYKLFSGQKCTGIGIQLDNWNYPVVIDAETGKVKYDNYKGSWGEQVRLDEFVQATALEAMKIQAELANQQWHEEVQEDGTIKGFATDYTTNEQQQHYG